MLSGFVWQYAQSLLTCLVARLAFHVIGDQVVGRKLAQPRRCGNRRRRFCYAFAVNHALSPPGEARSVWRNH